MTEVNQMNEELKESEVIPALTVNKWKNSRLQSLMKNWNKKD